MARQSVAFPDARRLDVLLLSWLLAHPGLQRRRDLVTGAAEQRNFASAIRRVPSNGAASQYPDLLRERLNYRVWGLREEGLIENPARGMYRLTRSGRAAARRAATRRLPAVIGPAPQRRERRQPRKPEDEHPLGRLYTPVDMASTSRAPAPFSWDPNERDRHTQAHQRLVHALAQTIEELGFVARLPREVEVPLYDLAYDHEGEFTVIEVKSLPADHAVSQLRLGLGQVLEYRHELRRRTGRKVCAVLAVPVSPPKLWIEVCWEAEVRLIWPPNLGAQLSKRRRTRGLKEAQGA